MWSIGPCPTTLGSLDNFECTDLIFWECIKALEERHNHALAVNGYEGGQDWKPGPENVKDMILEVPATAADLARTAVTWGRETWPNPSAMMMFDDWMDEGGPQAFSTPDFADGWGSLDISPTWGSLSDFLNYAIGQPAFTNYSKWWRPRGGINSRMLEELRMCFEAMQYCQVYPSSNITHVYNGIPGYGWNSWSKAWIAWKKFALLKNLIENRGGTSLQYWTVGTYARWIDDWSAPRGHACRYSLILPLTRTRQMKCTIDALTKDHPSAWTARLMKSLTAYPGGDGHYGYGDWVEGIAESIVGQPFVSGADTPTRTRLNGKDISFPVTQNPGYVQWRGSEADPPDYPPDTAHYYSQASVNGWFWEYGNYQYGNPNYAP